jgi:bifunctional NMN adenylyltransferase/nudix hydrolase
MKAKVDKTDVGVLVGRFQVHSLHDAHVELIQTVCDNHAKVIIFLGLSPCLVTRNNPLDFESRKQMILEKFPNVNVLYIKDVHDDKLWSRKLDESIHDLVSPNQTVTLYGGRDSFIKHYTGKYKTQELESDRIMSGSEIRKEISAKVKADPSFRAGVIWASHNQYPKVLTCVDVAVYNDKGEFLFARKPNETLYRFIGGFSDPRSKSFEIDVKREVSEEAHIEIDDIRYMGSTLIDDWRYRGEVDKIKTLFFKAKYVFGSPQADDDIAELRWIHTNKVVDVNFKNSIVPEHHPLLELMTKNFNY